MPAYFDTGFSIRQTPWHGLGMVADDYPEDWATARKWAGLEWEPSVRPSYLITDQINDRPVLCPVPGTNQFVVEDPAHRLIVRDDTDAVLGAGLSPDYTPVPNGTLGEIVEALCADTSFRFETAGSVKGGQMVWALGYLDEPVRVAGDDTDTYPFLAVMNSHDGTTALRVNFTSVRIVCWNTYQAAVLEGERSGRQFTFRHSGRVMERIEDAKLALAGLREETADWVALAEDLATLRIDERQLDMFLSEFFALPEGDVVSPRVRNNAERARTEFRRTFLDGVTCEGHRGTALGLVDAGVEYLDHVRGFRHTDSYVGRTLLRPEPAKAKLVVTARRAAAY